MKLTIDVTGVNLEKLLTLAAQNGIVVLSAQRKSPRILRMTIAFGQQKALYALCSRYGWACSVVSRSALLSTLIGVKRRPMLAAGAALCVLLVMISSQIIWRIRIEDAGKTIGELRQVLAACGVRPGALKAGISLSSLRETILLQLPDLAYASLTFEGSTLVVDCQRALEGENVHAQGKGRDLVAGRDGIVTRLNVQSGTPKVSVGQAVRRGDVLIAGEERGEKQSVHPVQAEGMVQARVWVRGDAKAPLNTQRTVETGEYRQRVALCTPWSRRVIREAEPFELQDESTQIEKIVGLYLPLWLEITTYAQIVSYPQKRSEAQAAEIALAAAERLAKKQCPAGVRILDKTAEYSMIDNEYVYATVVLEYEQNIAVRADSAVNGL